MPQPLYSREGGPVAQCCVQEAGWEHQGQPEQVQKIFPHQGSNPKLSSL